MNNAERDQNRVTTLLAVSSVDGVTPVTLYADPTTHRLLVEATGPAVSPLTTKGDLFTYTSANARLGVGTDGQILMADSATATGLKWETLGAGTGDVVGPASATDNAIARYDATTGKIIQDSSVWISDAGYLGIGTNAPAYLLDMYAASGSQYARLTSGAISTVLMASTVTSRGYVGTLSNHPFTIRTNATDRVSVDASGNVGIGTTSPGELLEVAGNIKIDLITADNKGLIGKNGSAHIFSITRQNTTANASVNFSTYGDLLLNAGATTGPTSNSSVIIKADGKVGVGTQAPTHSFTLPSSSTGIAMYNTADQTTNYERVEMKWNSNRFDITIGKAGTGSNRNLRIGTPSRAFDIFDSPSGTDGFYNLTTSTSSTAVGVSIKNNRVQSSGIPYELYIGPTYTGQTGTAGWSVLVLNAADGTGTGAKYLADFQAGGVSKFNVANTGKTYIAGIGAGNTDPQLALTNTNTGFNVGTGDTSGIGIAINGAEYYRFRTSEIRTSKKIVFGGSPSSLGDAGISRVSAGILAIGTGGDGSTAGGLQLATVNGLTITTTTGALTIANGKTLTVSNTITLAGTDSTVMTFPSSSATIARTDAGQTFTGVQVFTSPRIITDISDTNGNEIFKITATASAVNEFTIANAATGNSPTLSATGSDSNIDINLVPKGNGIVKGELKRFMVRLKDSTTNLATGTTIGGDFRIANRAITIKAVGAYVDTAATGGTLLTIDINEAGSTILSTKITLDASEKTSTTAVTPAVISDSAIAADAVITFDIDAVGNTTPGTGLVVWIDYVYA